jgi:Domain of unknown function (DUF4932)/WD40-like Beta Propeller Repeat
VNTILRLLFVFIFSIGLTVPTIVAQESSDAKTKADRYFKAGQYARALPLFEKQLLIKENIVTRTKLAFCYKMMNRMDKARELYAQLTSEERARPETFLYYGEALMNEGLYEDAKIWLRKYLAIKADDEKAASLLVACDYVKTIRPLFPNLVVKPFSGNTNADEMAGVMLDKHLIFASDRSTGFKLFKERSGWTGRDYLNIYTAALQKDSSYLKPKFIAGKINVLNKNTASPTFTEDGKTMFFTRNSMVANKNGSYTMQLYSAKQTEKGKWKDVEPLSFCVSELTYMHPAVTPDGNTLYFVSNKPGGEGGIDIYVSYKRFGEWTKPENLGPTINTAANDGFPFVHPDGRLFFCSKGHPGYGGFDIFYTERDANGRWKKPVNAGKPINSSADDVSIFIAKDSIYGFFTSSREGGDDDIYIFTDTLLMAQKEGRAPRTAPILPSATNENTEEPSKLVEKKIEETPFSMPKEGVEGVTNKDEKPRTTIRSGFLEKGKFNAQNFEVETKTDPRLELLRIVYYLATKENLNEDLLPLPTQYLNDLNEFFKKAQNHEAISAYKNVKSYQGDFPTRYAIYLDYNFYQTKPLSQRDSLDLIELGIPNTTKFFKSLHSFAKESNIKEFMKGHRKVYRDMLVTVSDSLLKKDWIGMTQRFFGDVSPKKWTIVFDELNSETDFSFMNDSLSSKNIAVAYAFLNTTVPRATLSKKATLPLVLTLNDEKATIFFRESARNYTYASFKKQIEKLAPKKAIFSSSKDKAAEDWKLKFQETTNRAIAAVLVKTYINPTLGNDEIERQTNNGYPYIRDIANLIENEYLPNRTQYKDFNSFYKRLIGYFVAE